MGEVNTSKLQRMANLAIEKVVCWRRQKAMVLLEKRHTCQAKRQTYLTNMVKMRRLQPTRKSTKKIRKTNPLEVNTSKHQRKAKLAIEKAVKWRKVKARVLKHKLLQMEKQV